MKTKSVTKRVLSVILCTVMLFSCWVFSAPTAVAQNAGNYDVRVTINVTGTNNIKEAYQGFESAKGDSAGVTIRCLKDNGVSTTTTDLNWDIGNGKTGNSYIKSTGNHTLTGTAAGFPAYIYLYLCDNYIGSGVGYQVTKLEVKGTSQTSYTTLWSGTMQVTSKTNGYGGWLRYDGHVKGFDHGLKNADEGSKGDNNNYINTADKKGWLANFPYRSSGGAVSASNITLDGVNSKTSAFTVGDAKDQYSVNYATSNLDSTAMSTPSYNSSYITYSGDSGNPARTITATKNAHIWNDGVNSQNVSVTAYWKTRNTTNTINNTTTAKTITITDEKYTYTWNWKETNTSNLDSPTDKDTTLSPYYGDTPSIPTTATATTAYYTSSKHWSGGSYTSPDRASAAKSYTMTYSVNGVAHSYAYSEISGNHTYHKGTCTCGYSKSDFAHDYDTTTFTFAADGKSATATRVCKTNGCRHTQTADATVTSVVKTPETCTEMGTTTYTATSPFDGDDATKSVDIQDIAALGHDWGAWSPASGTEHSRTCSRCGAVDSSAHVYDDDPTYISNGNGKNNTHYYACKTDGCGYQNTSPHTWNEGMVTTAAKCESDGVKTYTCTAKGCGATYTEVIPATGHAYGDWADDGADNHKRICANDANHVETEAHNFTAWSNTVPEGDAKLAAAMKQDYDASAECFRYCTVCYRVEYKEHSYNETVSKQATCTEEGITTYTCQYCSNSYTKTDIPAKGHIFELTAAQPQDNQQGYACYHCTREKSDGGCGKYWVANYVYNEEKEQWQYEVPGETDKAGVENITDITTSDPIPQPFFNDYQDGELDYYYRDRGCSLKLMKDAYVDTNTRQDFRFSGSVQIPAGVSYKVNNPDVTDNVITDFGFVYTQDSYGEEGYGADKLTLANVAKDNHYAKMSVVDNNAGSAFDGSNWSGVTYHKNGNIETLTFNLVISIKAKNWKKQYAARPYITYKYHGQVFTVYDTGASDQSGGDYQYSYGSIYAIAAETIMYGVDPVVKNYVINRFINHRGDFGEDDAQGIDWWRYYFATTWAEFEQSDFGTDYKNALAPYEDAT